MKRKNSRIAARLINTDTQPKLLKNVKLQIELQAAKSKSDCWTSDWKYSSTVPEEASSRRTFQRPGISSAKDHRTEKPCTKFQQGLVIINSTGVISVS